MNLKATLIACAAPVLLASIAAANDGCRYDGIAYSHGASVCQSGTQYRCNDGEWKSLSVQCKPEEGAPPNCDFKGSTYSPGSTSCQSGMQFKCTDGTWTNLAVACSEGAPIAADAPRPPRTCMLEGTTVASASTVCKEGTTYLCNDGDWRNLGTACR